MTKSRNSVTYVALLIGAAVGLGAEWLWRPEADRRLFLAAFTASWLAMGMVAIITGEVLLDARSEPSKHWNGMPARVLGVIMSLAAVVMYLGASRFR